MPKTPPRPASLAVIPLQTLGGEPGAGVVMAEKLYAHINAVWPGTVLPRETVRTRLKPLQGRTAPIAELAKALQCEAVLSGTVNEYGYGPDSRPRAGMTLHMTDLHSGAILWRLDLTGIGRQILWQEETLDALAERLARKAALAMAKGSGHE